MLTSRSGGPSVIVQRDEGRCWETIWEIPAQMSQQELHMEKTEGHGYPKEMPRMRSTTSGRSMLRALLLAVGLPGLLILVMAGISHAAGSVALFCLVYGATSLRSPLLSARLNAHISSANRATVLSLVSMLSGLYVAGMGLVIGRVADASIPLALVVMGGLVSIGTLGTAVAVRE